jgi:hypothetical protein
MQVSKCAIWLTDTIAVEYGKRAAIVRGRDGSLEALWIKNFQLSDNTNPKTAHLLPFLSFSLYFKDIYFMLFTIFFTMKKR